MSLMPSCVLLLNRGLCLGLHYFTIFIHTVLKLNGHIYVTFYSYSWMCKVLFVPLVEHC